MKMAIFSCWLLLLLGCSVPSKGVLVFWSPFHDPRIYEGAPGDVHVTRIHALDEAFPQRPVAYSLLDVKDYESFSLDHSTGNLTTARKIDRNAGEKYEVIVAAVSQGVTELKTLQISVTLVNRYAPQFERPLYRAEVHQTRTRMGYRVMQVRAHDADPVPYNAEVYYSLESSEGGAARFFALDTITGELTLNRSLSGLSETTLTFSIMAEDGGSPKKWAWTRVEIKVKTISEPLNVRSLVFNETAVRICWLRPSSGNVSGYVIKYRAAADNATSYVNVTTDAQDKCTPVHDLKPWAEYEYRVFGWNSREEGLGSPVDRFATRLDYCLMNVCKHGACETTGDKPGYRCLCEPGYFDQSCDSFDPCSQTPCKTFGTCVNTSHAEYRCDCFTGFSGRNCTTFNPCALNPSPCLHDGVCISNASHTFTCHCVGGYYGKTCRNYDPCFSQPCLNGGQCRNQSDTLFTCQCAPGFAGHVCEQNIDECLSNPCKNRGECEDAINGFICNCQGGYKGSMCEIRESCPEEFQQTDKGLFHWLPIPHGSIAKVECPYGAYNPASDYKYARRKCRLLSNGQAAWVKVSSQHCRYKSFQAAENITAELEFLTHDPSSIRPDQIRYFADKIEPVVDYAVKDIKIAQAMIHVISNFLALNDSVLEEGDANGSAVEKLVGIVERFTSEVILGPGALIIENENLVVKAIAWSPKLLSQGQDILSFSLRSSGDHYLHEDFSGDGDEQEEGENIVITIPFEALSVAINSSGKESERGPRIAFVSYRNDKFFRPRHKIRGALVSTGQVVLTAKIGNTKIENLTDPLVYTYPTYIPENYVCAFWDEKKSEWSTEGITTNLSGNVTICTSTHMTAFSLLLDPMPDVETLPHHMRILSMISYVGCILSIVGLCLTLLTYTLFRCLNKDRSGKILLNLCVSMLLLNASFLVGSLHEKLGWIDLCFAVAIAMHYFLLTSLAWMGAEALNMYQMLIHVFASSETCFMFKRCIVAWGMPAAVVAACVLIDVEPYRSHKEDCYLTSANPYIYYIGFLGLSCLILTVNLLVFIMVTRVLCTSRSSSKSAGAATNTTPPITSAQVRGAFTVMTLLGVTWILGVFAVGEARTIFQYIFCVCNSLQGFTIFVIRVVQYPEARSAWTQLFKTGTFKRHRGTGPPGGSWYANSNPKQNSHSSMVRVTSSSTDSTSTVVFNSNIWNRSSGKDCPTRLSRFSGMGSLLKNCNLQKEEKKANSLPRKRKGAKVEQQDTKEGHNGVVPMEFYSSTEQVAALSKVPDIYKEDLAVEHALQPNLVIDSAMFMEGERPTTLQQPCDGYGVQKAHILFAYADGPPIRINGVVHTPVDKPKVECLSTFQPAPQNKKADLSQSLHGNRTSLNDDRIPENVRSNPVTPSDAPFIPNQENTERNTLLT
ncbi:adhesion G protein-coupled receptor E1-like [Ornithodoros turicata]